MENVQEQPVIDRLFELIDRFDLSNAELAGLTGLAPHTVRVVRLSREMPRHAHCRRALRAFVLKNARITAKSALRAAVSP